MNKTDFIRATSATIGESEGKAPTLKDTTMFVDGTIQTIVNQLISGEKVSFSGFGTFELVERAAHEGRNPQDGSVINIPATKVIKFKPSSVLKAAVNE